MERVSTIKGDLPLLVIVPHGADDHGTAEIADCITQNIPAYAVINRGWQRAEKVDYWKDQANCNDIRHLLSEQVLTEEFLNPIRKFVDEIEREHKTTHIFVLHGISNFVRTEAEDDDLDIIVGNGAPPHYSCDPKIKNAFLYYLAKEGFVSYESSPDGPYAGRSKYNINQLFKRWYPDPNIHSLQLEIVKELRESDMWDVTGDCLASAMDKLLDFDDATKIIHKAKQF